MSTEECQQLIASAFSEAALKEAVQKTISAGYEKCSLCNNIIDGEVTHMLRDHPHVRHLHTLLAKPVPPLTEQAAGSSGGGCGERRSEDRGGGGDDGDAAALAVGAFAVAASASADRGEAAFRVVQRAQAQLHRLLDGVQGADGHVYLFGSVVSMGSWDGVGDGDFAFVCPRWYYVPALDGQVVVEPSADEERGKEGADDDDDDEEEEGAAVHGDIGAEKTGDDTAAAASTDAAAAATADGLEAKALSSEKEKRIIRGITARLRDAGFRFEELDPVLHTRIPVVRRKRTEREPLKLHATPPVSQIRFRFDSSVAEQQFRGSRLATLIDTYAAIEVPGLADPRARTLVLNVPDTTDAIHLMSRRERIHGVRKDWLGFRRTPEIFSIDFDLSCRFHGIRNSWLLRRYLAQDAVFRLGNAFLKTWSKACGVNNSRIGFLTSYAVSVLWIYYLLRRGEVEFVNPADVPVLPDPEEQMNVPYIALWPPLEDAAAELARQRRLGTLLRGFFFFYGEAFDWATHVVTIRQPGTGADGAAALCTKADLGWEKSDTLSLVLRDRCYHIFSIEDVYEDDLDLGRHLTPEKADWTRLQFRLAYQRCCCAASSPSSSLLLWRLLDVPRQRAEDTLRAELSTTLLLDTEDASSTVAEALERLQLDCEADGVISEDDDEGEGDASTDPVYLACAYELGNRLSDLWFDEAQVAVDIANHKKHDRRATDYTAPMNPTLQGQWAVVCDDPLLAESDAATAFAQRSVRLVPPRADGDGPGGAPFRPTGAPGCGRRMLLTKSRRQAEQVLGTLEASPEAVGVDLSPKDAAGAAYPRCYFPLQQRRLFATYDARAAFTRAAEDAVAELARLRDDEVSAASVQGSQVLHNRTQLLGYLKERRRSSALPRDAAYEAALAFICDAQQSYLIVPPKPFHGRAPNTDSSLAGALCPSGALLTLLGGGSGGGGTTANGATAAAVAKTAIAATRPASSAGPGRAGPIVGGAPRATATATATAAAAPASAPAGVRAAGASRAPAPPPPLRPANAWVANPPPPRAPMRPTMDQRGRKMGTCGECGRHNLETFPALQRNQDAGFYCVQCWASYA